jgi:glycosyltransferase involved in cell wall biosynthesis
MEANMLEEITPLILTYNEAPNIERTLKPLNWARQIMVIDSGSTDRTLDILQHHPNVRVIYRQFDDHTSQWNFGLSQVSTPWTLSLDADYIVSQRLVEELRTLNPADGIDAYAAGFRYLIFGKPLRGNLYPERLVLFRREACHYIADGHTQILRPRGAVRRLKGRIDHDDQKPLSRWLDSQRAYACLEADLLTAASPGTLGWADRLRHWIWPAAPAAFLYTLFFKGCLFDGWRGWFYVLQRTYAELLLSLELLDRRLRGATNY